MRTPIKILIVFGACFILGASAVGGFLIGLNSIEKEEIDDNLEIDEKAISDDIPKSSRNNKQGPYYHSVYSATSSDGIIWEKNGVMLFDHASVPGAVIMNEIIYLYFVDASEAEDQLSVGISNDLGETFTKHKVVITDMPHYDAVDPHPELVNGQIHLYYLGDFMTGHNKAYDYLEVFTIYSAVSDDGINFSEQKVAYISDSVTTDPDVFKTDSDWKMFVSQGGGLELLTSSDGGITFTEITGFSWNEGGVCDTIEISGIYHTYYCGGGIKSAKGGEEGTLVQESGTRIDDKDEEGKIICDPSVIELSDGSYMMFYKVQDIQEKK